MAPTPDGEPVACYWNGSVPLNFSNGRKRSIAQRRLNVASAPKPDLALAASVGASSHPDQREGYDYPAVSAILTLAGDRVSAAEERCARHREECDRKGNQRGVGEGGGRPAATPREARGAARVMNLSRASPAEFANALFDPRGRARENALITSRSP